MDQGKAGHQPVSADNNHGDLRVVAFEKKLKLCGDFLAATIKLKEALARDAIEEAAGLIRKRSALVSAIDDIDKRIARHAGKTAVGINPADNRERTALTEKITDRLKQAFIVNGECEDLAAGRRQELKDELGIVNREAAGIRGYARRGEKTPKFLNIKT
jgi:hypothetical protein